MDHQSNSTNVFIRYHQLIGVRSTDRGPEFYANPKEGCHNLVCSKCIFGQAEECYIGTLNEAYSAIFAYFQTHHPEKLI